MFNLWISESNKSFVFRYLSHLLGEKCRRLCLMVHSFAPPYPNNQNKKKIVSFESISVLSFLLKWNFFFLKIFWRTFTEIGREWVEIKGSHQNIYSNLKKVLPYLLLYTRVNKRCSIFTIPLFYTIPVFILFDTFSSLIVLLNV